MRKHNDEEIEGIIRQTAIRYYIAGRLETQLEGYAESEGLSADETQGLIRFCGRFLDSASSGKVLGLLDNLPSLSGKAAERIALRKSKMVLDGNAPKRLSKEKTKPHWTQTAAGRRRMATAMKKVWAKKQKKSGSHHWTQTPAGRQRMRELLAERRAAGLLDRGRKKKT